MQDLARAKKFYESVLKVKLEKLDSPGMDMWAFPMEMDRCGAGGSLVKAECACSGGNSTLVYFSCEDCALEESRVEKCGGRVERKKMSIGEYGFISLVIDTEGNKIGLHSLK